MSQNITQKTDIDFWSRQLSEHALFMSMGLDKTYAPEAERLYKVWEEFRAKLPKLSDAEAKAKVLDMAAELRAFKVSAIRGQEKSWNGWLFPLFLEHVVRELDLFAGHLGGSIDPQKELCSWLTFMAEHAAFAAHLLDPREQTKIHQALHRAKLLRVLEYGCGSAVTGVMLKLSASQGHKLDAYFQGLDLQKTKSVIHPVLAAHVVREGQRFLETLSDLTSHHDGTR